MSISKKYVRDILTIWKIMKMESAQRWANVDKF